MRAVSVTSTPSSYANVDACIHGDKDAEEVAAALYKQGAAFEDVRQDVYSYLVECWKATPAWNDPEFIRIVRAVINPVERTIAIAGFDSCGISLHRT